MHAHNFVFKVWNTTIGNKEPLETSAAMVVPVRAQVPDFPGLQSRGWHTTCPRVGRRVARARQHARCLSSASSRVEFQISFPSPLAKTRQVPCPWGFRKTKADLKPSSCLWDGSWDAGSRWRDGVNRKCWFVYHVNEIYIALNSNCRCVQLKSKLIKWNVMI